MITEGSQKRIAEQSPSDSEYLSCVFVSGSPAPFDVDTPFIDSGFACTVTQQFHQHRGFPLIRAGNIGAVCQVDPFPESSFSLWFSAASWEFQV